MPRKLTKTPGPKPDRLKIDGPWDAAMARSLKAQKPPDGWPKPEPKPQRAPKSRKAKSDKAR
jgi:hypothetical protein